MKLDNAKIEVESSGSMSTGKFDIGDKALIMDILRNKLYPDAIKAVVREIACNARDANREVGKGNVPIIISFPNAFDQHLRIQDFGPGISKERMELFLNYGMSTKRNDNTQTGGFGIGSKTPFSYSDTFSISTTHNFIKRDYIAYIDESREGRCDLVSESSGDQNGTIISIPVKKHDVKTFIDSVISQTSLWKIRPELKNIVPLPTYEFDTKYKKLMFGTDWEIYSIIKNTVASNYYGNYNSANKLHWFDRSIITVDGVVYPLVLSSIVNIEQYQKDMLNNLFVIDFPIGSLSISANREELHYDEKTQKVILNKILEIESEIQKSFTDDLQKKQTYIEACMFFDQIKALNLPIDKNSPHWNGHPISGTVLMTHLLGPQVLAEEYELSTSYRRGSGNKKRLRKNNYVKDRIVLSTDVPTFFDTAHVRGYKDRIHYFLESHPEFNKIQLLRLQEGTPINSDLLKLIGTRELEKIINPNKPKRTYNKRPKFNLYEFDFNFKGGKPKDNYWKPVLLDFEEESDGVYVTIDPHNKGNTFCKYVDNSDPTFPTKRNWIFQTSSLQNYSEILNEPIYAIKEPKEGETLELADDWISLKDALVSLWEELLLTISVEDAKIYLTGKQFLLEDNDTFEKYKGYIENHYDRFQFPELNTILHYFNESNAYKIQGEKFEKLLKLSELLSRHDRDKYCIKSYTLDDAEAEKHPLNILKLECIKKYNMLAYQTSYSYSSGESIDEFFTYINLIDSVENFVKTHK